MCCLLPLLWSQEWKVFIIEIKVHGVRRRRTSPIKKLPLEAALRDFDLSTALEDTSRFEEFDFPEQFFITQVRTQAFTFGKLNLSGCDGSTS